MVTGFVPRPFLACSGRGAQVFDGGEYGQDTNNDEPRGRWFRYRYCCSVSVLSVRARARRRNITIVGLARGGRGGRGGGRASRAGLLVEWTDKRTLRRRVNNIDDDGKEEDDRGWLLLLEGSRLLGMMIFLDEKGLISVGWSVVWVVFFVSLGCEGGAVDCSGPSFFLPFFFLFLPCFGLLYPPLIFKSCFFFSFVRLVMGSWLFSLF